MFNKKTAVNASLTLTEIFLARAGETVFILVQANGSITTCSAHDRLNARPPLSETELQNRLGIYEHVDARSPDARSGEVQAFASLDDQDEAREENRNPAQFWLRSGPLYGPIVIALGFGDIEDDRRPPASGARLLRTFPAGATR